MNLKSIQKQAREELFNWKIKYYGKNNIDGEEFEELDKLFSSAIEKAVKQTLERFKKKTFSNFNNDSEWMDNILEALQDTEEKKI